MWFNEPKKTIEAVDYDEYEEGEYEEEFAEASSDGLFMDGASDEEEALGDEEVMEAELAGEEMEETALDES